MFRRKDPQGELFEASNLFPEDKRERLLSIWPHAFRERALPLIDEDAFRDLYSDDNGRPNKPVQTVIGILILKEIHNLTDQETIYRVDFDLGWHHALRLTPEQAHCCQKTLHNFRVKLMANDRAQQLFVMMTDQIIDALGIDTDKQRLDSTHVLSNIAVLTRLGLFCETIRVFLRDVRQTLPEQWAGIPAGLRQRYLKDDGGDTDYNDAPSPEMRRRLAVCARDLWRLCDRFRGKGPAAQLSSYELLQRLLAEQCDVSATKSEPAADDADHNDEPVPVQLKENKKVAGASLQTPHDADATYGHKGKGYEVQLAETCGNDDKPEIITYVDVTPAAGSDATQTVPVVQALAGRDVQPKELMADTTYAGTDNVSACAKLGTELVGPVPGPKVAAEALEATDVPGAPPVTEPQPVPADTASVVEEATMPAPSAPSDTSRATPLLPSEPTLPSVPDTPKGTKAQKVQERRRYQATPEFRARYAQRAGIEATNSELKRRHGLGRLRVRGGDRVKLAVHLKALACNIKRMIDYLAERARKALAATAEPALGLT